MQQYFGEFFFLVMAKKTVANIASQDSVTNIITGARAQSNT